MSIETLLTLGVAAAILAAAAALRLIFLVALRLVYMLTGRHITWGSLVHPLSARARPRAFAADGGLSEKLSTWIRSGARAAATFPERLRQPTQGARDALTELGTALIHLLATVGSWLSALGEAGVSAGRLLHDRARPWLSTGAVASGRALASAARRLGSFSIVAVATMQHFAGATATRLRKSKQERAGRARGPALDSAGRDRGSRRSMADRLIVLDEAWDPLTDPLEDEPASSVR